MPDDVNIVVEVDVDDEPATVIEVELEGAPGRSAYQVAVDNGFEGSVSEWLASLIGEINSEVVAEILAPLLAAREITAGTGLAGGGDLTADRTISLSEATQTSLGKADTALQSAPVVSVNAKTGAVTLTQDDIGNGTANKTYSSADKTRLANTSGTNTGDQDLSGYQQTSQRNQNNGYAGLDSTGKVAAAQLPSYVDDVVEASNLAGFPGAGETSKIYVAVDTNKTYRWSGSAYVEISPSPGSTDAVTEGSTNLYYTPDRVDARIPAAIVAASSKTTPVDADTFPMVDSAGGNALKKWSFANLKSVIKTWYDDVTSTLTHKTINLADNTVTFTKAQLDSACSDSDVVYIDNTIDVGEATVLIPGGGEQVVPRFMTSSTTIAFSNQGLRGTCFTARKTESITQIRSYVSVAQIGASKARIGVYSVDASDNLTLVASTVNDTALWATTTGAHTRSLSSTFNKVRGQRYAVCLLVDGTSTAPTVVGMSSNAAMVARVPRVGISYNGQTDLPSSVLVGSINTSGVAPYFELLP